METPATTTTSETSKKHKLDDGTQQASNASSGISGTSGPKKHKSSHMPFKNWKKHTQLFKSTEAIRGVLLTGDHTREGNMIGEMLNIFKFFVDLFYPQLSGLSPIPSEAPAEDAAKTTEQTKEKTEGEKKKQKLFEVINSGCSGMAIISLVPKEIDPVDLVRRAFAHIIDKAEPVPKFYADFTNRVIPLEATCEVSASLDTIIAMAKPVIESHFSGKPAMKFAIRIEHRNCNDFDKKKCIDMLAPLVDPAHTVDLDNPDLVIMVQIFKSAAGISVLPDYNKLRKYNIKEVFKTVHGATSKKKGKKGTNPSATTTTTTTAPADEKAST